MKIKRIQEELWATIKIARVISLKSALTTLIAKCDMQRMNHNGYKETLNIKKRLLKKHKIMIEYFEKTFSEFLSKYEYYEAKEERFKNVSDTIWICWWQGEENAPELVKKCIESIRKNSNGHPVVLITDKNYKNYIDVPEWLEEKHKKGIITNTNYSDLLRLSLLARYGGIWLDATFFCTSSLEKYFSMPLWTIKRPDYNHASVASGYFAGYSLGCNYEKKWIFAIVRDFFINYWRENNKMIDYLLIDYMIVLAQRKFKKISEEFEKVPNNNSLCDELVKILNNTYDENEWCRIKESTNLFKLTWKQKFLNEKDGRKTFYGMIISENN